MTRSAADCQRGDTRFAVTAFGETMLRYSVPAGNYFVKTGSFDVHVGGSESNVCAAVAQLGHAAGWFSALPDNRLGDMVLYRLNAAGVDTRHVIRKAGSRLGTYYLDAALPPNVSDVIYDRERSAFAELTAADIDVDKVLDTAIFHGTGITAGLGGAPAELLLDLLREARKRGITTTFDVNFRAGLWTAAAAAERLKEFLAEADVVFCSQRDAAALFGAGADAAAAGAALSGCSAAHTVVITLGEAGAWANCRGQVVTVPAVPTRVVDRPGAGDAFVAGVLSGLLTDDLQAGLQRGAALASRALAHRGDIVSVSRHDLGAGADPESGGIRR